MSNESCLLDLLAAVRNGNGDLQRKTIGKWVRHHGGGWALRRIRPVLVHRAKMEEKDFIDKMESMMSFRDPMLRKKDAVSFAPDGSRSTRGPMTLLSYVIGGLPRSSVVVAVTNTSTSQKHLTWR